MDQETVLTGAGLDMMATFGKTAVSLVVVLALIYGLAALIKILKNPVRSGSNRLLRQVTSTAVGPKERVVVLELDKTWLIVGVGGGQVTLLKEMPAPELPSQGSTGSDHFARRLQGFLRRGEPPADSPRNDPP